MMGGKRVRASVVATLGFSRRLHVRAFRSEAQESWFSGMESAFAAFGGTTEEVLFDNARALVERHDATTREVVFNAWLHAFARHWGFRPRACAPYRARTKGKDERGVGYVKRNAIAGRSFPSWNVFEAHLAAWTGDVADLRVHGTTGEAPAEQFRRAEIAALRPLGGRTSFHVMRELVRRVQSDCAVEVETNSYSVPWRLIGERVRVSIAGGVIRIAHGGRLVATHQERCGRHERAVNPVHFEGVAGFREKVRAPSPDLPAAAVAEPALLRPLAEYEAAIGGAW